MIELQRMCGDDAEGRALHLQFLAGVHDLARKRANAAAQAMLAAESDVRAIPARPMERKAPVPALRLAERWGP